MNNPGHLTLPRPLEQELELERPPREPPPEELLLPDPPEREPDPEELPPLEEWNPPLEEREDLERETVLDDMPKAGH